MTPHFFAKVGIFLITFLTFEKNGNNAHEFSLGKSLIICRCLVRGVGTKIVYKRIRISPAHGSILTVEP